MWSQVDTDTREPFLGTAISFRKGKASSNAATSAELGRTGTWSSSVPKRRRVSTVTPAAESAPVSSVVSAEVRGALGVDVQGSDHSVAAQAAPSAASAVDEQPAQYEWDGAVVADIALYEHGGAHRICRRRILASALRTGLAEWHRRFQAVPLSVDEANDYPDDPAVVLVGLDVASDWTPPKAFKGLSYCVMTVSAAAAGTAADVEALFVTCMPGGEHSIVDGFFQSKLGLWIGLNQLDTVMYSAPNGGHGVAGEKQPDGRLEVIYPAPGPPPDVDGQYTQSRVVLDTEFQNEGPKGIRRNGFRHLAHHYCRAYVCCKVWKRETAGPYAGQFAAVVVVWLKDNAGNVSVDQAFSFGTRPIHDNTRRAWARGYPAATHLPPVPVAGAHAFVEMAAPVVPIALAPFGAAPAVAWPLRIPQAQMLYEVYDSAQNQILPPLGVNKDFVLDLRTLQAQIHAKIP
eukprot:m.281638 g.281638  ORF g.281638 m.281638 type:complete len:459 (-) comp16175_c0_seq1:186-1562(-)